MNSAEQQQLRHDTAAHFDTVAQQLRRDITAMRDSKKPPRFDEALLDEATRHFEQGFEALQKAVRQALMAHAS
jgi:protoporphyrinogen oxidase